MTAPIAAPPTAPPSPQSFADRVVVLAADIKLSHSVFALPWAILATFIAAAGTSPTRLPRVGQIALIVACMVLARTAAMSANRLFDADLDRANPRTARRAVPSGRLSKGFVAAAIVGCALAFVGVTALFGVFYSNWIPLAASLPILGFICSYPFLKRFSRLCHYYLGAALALAPICAWVAIAGCIDREPLWMAAAVMLWTAGFDIIYACQDYENDRAAKLYSVPSGVGIANALWAARVTHVGCWAALLQLGLASPLLSTAYFCAIGVTAVLLIVEHAIVRPNDLSKVNVAFFTLNGIISLLIGTAGLVDVLRHVR